MEIDEGQASVDDGDGGASRRTTKLSSCEYSVIATNGLRDRAHQAMMPKLGRLGAAEGGRRASGRRRREKQRDVWRRTDPPVRRTVDVGTTCVFRFCFLFFLESAFLYRNNYTWSKTRVWVGPCTE
jgi:hypothetical protein